LSKRNKGDVTLLTLKYITMLCRMAVTKRTSVGGTWRKETLVHCRWQGTLVGPVWKTVWRVSKSFKKKNLHGPAISFLGGYPKEMIILKGRLHPRVYSSSLHNSQDIESN
jgi:hypothetical protein